MSSNVSAEQVGIFIAAGSAVAAFFINWRKILGKGESVIVSPQPIITKREVKTPTWDDHKALVERVEKVEGEVTEIRKEESKRHIELIQNGEDRKDAILEKIDEVRIELKESVGKTHARLDKHAVELAELRGEFRNSKRGSNP